VLRRTAVLLASACACSSTTQTLAARPRISVAVGDAARLGTPIVVQTGWNGVCETEVGGLPIAGLSEKRTIESECDEQRYSLRIECVRQGKRRPTERVCEIREQGRSDLALDHLERDRVLGVRLFRITFVGDPISVSITVRRGQQTYAQTTPWVTSAP
jgi:hypothetical protein